MTENARSDRARPPRWRSFVIMLSALIALSVYLFVQAPAPLDARPRDTATVPIRTVFSILELENDAARALWTEEIVERGTERGLAFGETWRTDGFEMGPLPALFLRETARNLERTSLRLGLFLGSRYPINAANQLAGPQAAAFDALATTGGAPQFFFEPATALQTAMFADRATLDACVTCHNEHPDSPKRDWRPHAIMGATTWMYPDEAVSAERAVEMVGALRSSIRAAYGAYLAKVKTFAKRPAIGDRWPRDGFYLPSEDEFMSELARRTSAATVQGLLEPGWAEATATLDPPRARSQPERRPADAAPRLLVIRSARSTRITIDHAGARIMVARLPAGGSTTLTARPPLRLQIGDPEGVEVEYGGRPIAVPRDRDARPTESGTDEVEVVLGPLAEKS